MARLECVRCGTEIPEGILRRCPKCGSSETRPKRRLLGGRRRSGRRGVGFVPVIAIVVGVIVAAFLPAIVDAVRDHLDDDEGARAAIDVAPSATSSPPPVDTVAADTLPPSADRAAACLAAWNGEGNGVTRSTVYEIAGLDRPSIGATVPEGALLLVMAVDADRTCLLHLRLVQLSIDLRYARQAAGGEWKVQLVSAPPPEGGVEVELQPDGTLAAAA
jgi:hypothetical protein